MITIPDKILDAARQSGVKAPVVVEWMIGQITGAGLSPADSPANWPQDVWDAYKTLREAHEPGVCSGGSAKRLFERLGITGDD